MTPSETKRLSAPNLDDSQAATRYKKLRAHIPALDGLRGLAILLVLVCHGAKDRVAIGRFDRGLLGTLRTGWIGVDLFFVLSGYLITGILLTERGENQFFRNFYIRRILRIFPLYYGFLFLCLVLLPAMKGLRSPQMITAAQHQIWLWTYSINLTNLFGYHIDFSIFSHLWSLAVEEHFYALWPLVIFLVSPARIALVPVGCLIGCFLLRWALVLASSDVWFIYAFTLTRLDGLVLGAAIAIAIHNQKVSARTMRTAKFIAWASAASVVPLFLRYGANFIAPVAIVFGYSLLALFFGSILLTVVTARSGMMMKVLATPFLRSFGKYSYCLYVIHYPLQPRVLNAVYFRQLETRWSIAPAVIVSIILDVAVMFLLSMGIWHLYEKHFVRLKHRFAPTSSEVAS